MGINPAALNWTALIGRILLALVFLGGLLHNLTSFQMTLGMMRAKLPGWPDFVLGVMLVFAIVMLVAGVTSLLLGLLTRWGALLLVLFLLLVTPIMHNFWALERPEFFQQLIHFQKNLSLLGGLLLLAAYGAGSISMDAKLQRNR